MPAKIVIPHTGRTPLIVHVPHAATLIGQGVRKRFVLDDEALAREVARVTDWDVDHLFSWALDRGGTLFVNQVPRLVLDPERFRDGDPAEDVGQGVVYTRTCDGALLAEISPEEREERIRELYDPYHEGFTALVRNTLERFGRALILDCHSFPTIPLPTETGASGFRPDICIGTDDFHTPPELTESLTRAFRAEGLTVGRNSPFAGTMVPLKYLGSHRRVASVMIEVRRDLYCDEATGERKPQEFERMRRCWSGARCGRWETLRHIPARPHPIRSGPTIDRSRTSSDSVQYVKENTTYRTPQYRRHQS